MRKNSATKIVLLRSWPAVSETLRAFGGEKSIYIMAEKYQIKRFTFDSSASPR